MRVKSEVLIDAGSKATPTGAVPAVASPPMPSPPVLERLHALVRKGYTPVIGTGERTDAVLLRHLGRAPDLLLHQNGVVEPADIRIPRHKRTLPFPQAFGVDNVAEHLRFMRFLETVPRASLRDRTRPWRHKYVYFPLVMLVLIGINLAFTALILEG